MSQPAARQSQDQTRTGSESLAVLFADLGGSTRLYDTLGDLRAREMTGEVLAGIIDEVRAAGGSVVKTIGDEVMCAFGDADAAFDAAAAILRALEAGSATHGMGVHVGFHYGPVVREKDDLFGDTVNVAARIVGLAKDGEILTTGQTAGRLSPDRRALTRLIDRRSLKGKEAKIEIHRVVLPQDVQLTTLNLAGFDEPSGAEVIAVVLRVGAQELTIDAFRPVATVGRLAGCDLVLADPGVSRQHARVELRDGKAYLCDISANGTLLIANLEEPTFLRREEAMLQGSGRFGLSDARCSEPVTPVAYQVKTGSLG